MQPDLMNSRTQYYRPISDAGQQSSVASYRGAGEMYSNDFLLSLVQDEQNRLIGSVPRQLGTSVPKTQTAPSLQLPPIVDEYRAGSMAPEAYGKMPDLPGGSSAAGNNILSSAGSIAGNVAGSIAQANANLSRTEYQNDIAWWKQQGRYWADPSADVRPDLDAYLSMMPSSTEALQKGTVTGGALEGGKAEYVMNKAGERALQGAGVAGGWGAAAGGALGIVEGLFSWSLAEGEDRKNTRRAQLEFERALKEWTIKRNRRLSEMRQKAYEKVEFDREKRESKAKAEKQEKVIGINARRLQMMNVLLDAGKPANRARNERLERWSK